jgi:hypothetical protein
MTTENRDIVGNPSSIQIIKTNSAMPLAELGTDPKMVQNALQFKVDPGVLRPLRVYQWWRTGSAQAKD